MNDILNRIAAEHGYCVNHYINDPRVEMLHDAVAEINRLRADAVALKEQVDELEQMIEYMT